MRIALDAMGGDRGAGMAVRGALAAVREREDLHVILIGPSDHLDQQLTECGGERDRISVHHATEVITMDDSPVDGVRKKKKPPSWWVSIW